MQGTKIEWTDLTWNPITGCTKGCSYCYAHKMATWFAGTKAFPNGFTPTLYEDRLAEPFNLKTAKRIFTCSMGELFSVNDGWTTKVITAIKKAPWHTFQLLTKNPQQLVPFSPFPDNCWVGVSVTNNTQFCIALKWLKAIDAKVKYISFEPLLEECEAMPGLLKLAGINWAIVGRQTPVGKSPSPKLRWIYDISHACTRAGVPIFFKNNLLGLVNSSSGKMKAMLVNQYGNLRQEYPK